MRLLHLLLATPAARAHARPEPPARSRTGPLVLGGQPWTAGTVIDASPERPGTRRPPRDAARRRASARRLRRSSSTRTPTPTRTASRPPSSGWLRSARGSPGRADPHDPAFGLFEVQVDGLGPLWGAEPVLVERVGWRAGERLLPGEAGPGRDRRHAVRGHGRGHRREAGTSRSSCPPGDDAAFLASYPAGLLTTDPDVRARLTRFGLRRIGAVAELPRSALVARFGEEGALLHARATRRGDRPVPTAASPRTTPARRCRSSPPVEELEALRFVLHRLADGARRAARRHAVSPRPGRRSGSSSTSRSPAPARPASCSWSSASPSRPPTPRPSSGCSSRVSSGPRRRPRSRGSSSSWPVPNPAAGQQLPLFVPQAARNARLGWQLVRLALTFGEDRLRRAVITDPEAPLPERRWAWQSVVEDGTSGDDPAAPRAPARSTWSSTPSGRLMRDPLERPPRARRGLQPLAGRGGVVARADRARLRQGRRAAAGSRSSTTTASPAPGTWSASTTERPGATGHEARSGDQPGSGASAGWRADRQADDKQDREQADDEDQCGDVTRLG